MSVGIGWTEAIIAAVERLTTMTRSPFFTRQELIDAELGTIIAVTGSTGSTPHQTLSRELQQLRDRGIIEFVSDGVYRLCGREATWVPSASKGVFVVGSHSIYADEPERFYRFGPQWLSAASRIAGNWIIYQEPRRAGPRGYYAVAKVGRIVPDPAKSKMFMALIEPGSYLEFGRDVPFRLDGRAIERGLLNENGQLNNGRATQSIRSISDEDFNRIVGMGLVEDDDTLPRVSDAASSPLMVREERAEWEGPVIDRATVLTNRVVRNRQFRKRVLTAYGATCALTGMKLINGGGRAETEAAHIMSVEAGGPDTVGNGIALSGTMHWMFDRGLVSLSDDGDILLSRAINDRESVDRLLFKDRKARLPILLADRPHARYLAWHRDTCFHN